MKKSAKHSEPVTKLVLEEPAELMEQINKEVEELTETYVKLIEREKKLEKEAQMRQLKNLKEKLKKWDEELEKQKRMETEQLILQARDDAPDRASPRTKALIEETKIREGEERGSEEEALIESDGADWSHDEMEDEGSDMLPSTNPFHKGLKEKGRPATKGRKPLTAECDVDLQIAKSGPHPMLTRYQARQQKTESDQKEAYMAPLLSKGPQEDRYVPWSFMDMITLAGRLTPLADGADRWIEKLEEITGGINLAAGDIKALLIKTAGHSAAREVFDEAKLPRVMTSHQYDKIPFNNIRPEVWAALRNKFPTCSDPTKLRQECLRDDESPAQFLHRFQQKWKTETGSDGSELKTSGPLFRTYIREAMPKEVQAKLDGVVGLMKMEWPLFSEHVIHYVNMHRAEKRAFEDQSKMLATKLTQLQIGELSKAKKEKERPKHQAALTVAATPSTESTPTGEAVVQAPVVSPVIPPPTQQMQYSAAPPVGGAQPQQTQPQPVPPIHVHLNQGGGPQQATFGRGRGGPPMRGRWRGPQGAPRRPPQGQYQQMPQAGPDMGQQRGRLQCWGCGQVGHMQRDCPTNPWMGPQPPTAGPATYGTGQDIYWL